MLGSLQTSGRQTIIGNLLLVVCCGFYLAWWVLAFRVNNPIKGIRSGWLLLPAVVAGLAAIILIVSGIMAAKSEQKLIPGYAFIIGGVVAYIIAAVVTVTIFKRQMTSELFLFIGWGALALAEVSALHGSGQLTAAASLIMVVVIIIVVAISLVCYVLFYRLEPPQAFIDGMLPLLLVGLTMVALSVCTLAFPVR